MPEGPEIRRAADKIAAKLTGQVVETVWFGLPRLEQFAPQLSGRRVVELETRGKALLIHFEHGLSLYSHNQLYGRWFVRSRESYPKTNRSLAILKVNEPVSGDLANEIGKAIEAHSAISIVL